MTGFEDAFIEGHVRGTVRNNFDRPHARIGECACDDCDIPFIGMTAEDYALHLVENHGYYARCLKMGDERSLLYAVSKAMRDSENGKDLDGNVDGGDR